MSLAQSLPDLRRDLRQLFVEGDLPTALTTLDELLPDPSEVKAAVTALRADFNQLNKDNFRGIIDPEEYAKRLAQINARFNDLLDALTEAHFEPAPSGSKNAAGNAKTGSVLYRIPNKMTLQKPTMCTIRVAVDEEAILEDIVLDDNVRLRQRVEVSEYMSAEIKDVADGQAFQITALNTPRQKVRETGYTQWLFRIVPLMEGEHPLMVKVSLMEFDPNTNEYVPTEVSIIENINIVTAAPAPTDQEEAPLRSAGQSFALGAGEQVAAGAATPSSPASAATPAGKSGSNKPLRAMALFLAFVMLGSATTWAAAPPDVRDWWVASFRDTEASYAAYVEKYRDRDRKNPRLEEAYFRLADKTNALADLHRYQDLYPHGLHVVQVWEKIVQLEQAAVAELQKQPSTERITQFLSDFPDSESLPAVKQVAEQLPPDQRAALLPTIETGYVRTMQLRPSRLKLEQYLRDFPQMGRLTDMAETVCPLTAVQPDVQPVLDKTIEAKVEAATTPAEVRALLPALQAGGSLQAAERVEQILAKKPAALSRTLMVEVQRVREQVAQRQCTLQLPEIVNNAPSAEQEAASTASSSGSTPVLDTTKPKVEVNTAARTADDSDGDGIANAADGCPNDPQKSKPGICGCGTPDTDTDGDGIPDCKDQCPSEKGAAVDKGCPPQAAAQPNTTRKSGLNMVAVNGGTFNMGSPDNQTGRAADECPHAVTVGHFSIGQYEVTQADWRAVMGSEPSHNKQCDECPVENVSWNDVQNFLKKLNSLGDGKQYRLPTEAEWEYAAKGGSQSRNYDYAGSDRPFEVAWFRVNHKQANNAGTQKTTRPVGARKPNELGIYDMSGNVWEWCSDFYKAYPNCTSAYGDGQIPVLRGGSWQDETPDCRTARRFGGGSTARMSNAGFRLALKQ